MAKPNYSFEKRQRELAKKKKKEEKRLRKSMGSDVQPSDDSPLPSTEGSSPVGEKL